MPKPEVKPVVAEVAAPKTGTSTGCEAYRSLINQYEWNHAVAFNVMMAESGCNPLNVGDNYPINGLHAVSCGLFQVRTLKGRPSCEELKDPAKNVEWAHKIYKGQGWAAWSVCRSKVKC